MMTIGQTGDFSNFCQNGDRRHHAFLIKCHTFNGRKSQRGQTAWLCKISWQSVKPLLRYGTFPFFQR